MNRIDPQVVYRRCRELRFKRPRLIYEKNHRGIAYLYVLYVCTYGRPHKRLWSTIAKPSVVGCGCKTSKSSHEHRVQLLVEYLTGLTWSKITKVQLRNLTGAKTAPHEIDLFCLELMIGIEPDGAQHQIGWGHDAATRRASKISQKRRDAAKDAWAARHLNGFIRLPFEWLKVLEAATDNTQLGMMRAKLREHGIVCRRDNGGYEPRFDLAWHAAGLLRLQKLASSRGYALSSTVYRGMGKLHTFECGEHGKFDRTPSSMLHVVGGCPDCSITRVAKVSKATKAVKSKERFLALCGNDFEIVGTYMSGKRKVKCKCLRHLQEFYALPQLCFNAGRVQGCKACQSERVSNCKGNATRRERAKIGFVRLLGTDNTMVGEYRNANTKIECKCLRHKTQFWAMPTECLRRGKITGCSECRSESSRANAMKQGITSRERSKAEFVDLLGVDYRMIGEYRDTATKVACECLHHNVQFLARPSECLHYERIIGCPVCKFPARATTLSAFRFECRSVDAQDKTTFTQAFKARWFKLAVPSVPTTHYSLTWPQLFQKTSKTGASWQYVDEHDDPADLVNHPNPNVRRLPSGKLRTASQLPVVPLRNESANDNCGPAAIVSAIKLLFKFD